jgi:hypothetical protein
MKTQNCLQVKNKRIGKCKIVCPTHGLQPMVHVTDTRAGCEKCYG